MDSVSKKIFEKVVCEWSETGNCINVKCNNNIFLLNVTSAIVWKMIDGERTTEEIINGMYDIYSENNSREHLEEICVDAISSMLQKNIIREIM